MARKEKYPWSTTAIGEAFEVPYTRRGLRSLRSGACYQADMYDRFYRVELQVDPPLIRVTRLQEPEPRGYPWEEMELGQWFEISRTECTKENVFNMMRYHNNKGGRRFYLENYSDRWRIYRTR